MHAAKLQILSLLALMMLGMAMPALVTQNLLQGCDPDMQCLTRRGNAVQGIARMSARPQICLFAVMMLGAAMPAWQAPHSHNSCNNGSGCDS